MADQLTTLRQLAAARPWRRSTLDPASAADLTAKLAGAVEAQQPIRFSVPFGGYKGWRQATAPWPNWAEVFWLAHLRRYGERLSAVHRPGVEISLSYCSGVLAAINNLPEAHQAIYIASLGQLCQNASTAGVRFSLVDIAAFLGGPEAALAAVQQRICELLPRWNEGMADRAERLDSARRNLVPKGVEDLSGLSPKAWEARAAKAALGCWAMESLEERKTFNRGEGRIQISHRRGRGPQLHLSSCHTSTLQPWVGSGYLEADGQGGWRPRILASAQVRQWLTLPPRGPESMPGLRQIGIL